MQCKTILWIPRAAEKTGISAPTVAKLLEHMRRLTTESQGVNMHTALSGVPSEAATASLPGP